MRKYTKRALVACVTLLATFASAAQAQVDFGLSGYKTFNRNTAGNGTTQTAPDSAGGMFEFRYIKAPLRGFEITYSFNPANQTYTPTPGACEIFCSNGTLIQKASQHEVGVDYVASLPKGRLRPFAVAGLGFMITVPGTDGYNLNTVVRPTYIYGGGADWALNPHLGLRVQFRDNVYKAPNLAGVYPTTGQFTHTAEPMAGIFFRL